MKQDKIDEEIDKTMAIERKIEADVPNHTAVVVGFQELV